MWFGEGGVQRIVKRCSVYWWAMGVGTVPAYPPCRGPASWMGARGEAGRGKQEKGQVRNEALP